MKKFAVVGVYGQGEDFTTGQAVKCFELINWLIKKFGKDNISIVNTYKWKKNPVKLFSSLIKAFEECETVIIMPAQHGLKIFAPLCYYFKKKYKRKVQYIVIGGWLADTLKTNNRIRKYVASFDGVFAETNIMVQNLKNVGIEKSYFLPNTRLIPENIKRKNISSNLIKVCTYSRVTEDKGILDAIKIIKKANKLLNKDTFFLDIYGKVSPEFSDKFYFYIKENKKIVKYCGIKNSDEGVSTLTNYFCLLFPTFYEGEGFAGTILDGLAAGTPVIANDWKYNGEIINDGVTGFIYPYRNVQFAAEKLCTLYKDKELYKKIQIESQKLSKKYTPDCVYNRFLDLIK